MKSQQRRRVLAVLAQAASGFAGFCIMGWWSEALLAIAMLFIADGLAKAYWWWIFNIYLPRDGVEVINWLYWPLWLIVCSLALGNFLACIRLVNGKPLRLPPTAVPRILIVLTGCLAIWGFWPLFVWTHQAARCMASSWCYTGEVSNIDVPSHAWHFHTAVRFGVSRKSTASKSPGQWNYLPRGSSSLVGRVEFNGPPVDAYVNATLDDGRLTQYARLDATNHFHINLPPGSYSVRAITLRYWANRPEGSSYFLAFNHATGIATLAFSTQGEPWNKTLIAGEQAQLPDLVLLPRMQLRPHMDVKSQVDQYVWDPVAGAVRYEIRFSADSDLAGSSPICVAVSEPHLGLNNSQIVQPDKHDNAYSVVIAAKDVTGNEVNAGYGVYNDDYDYYSAPRLVLHHQSLIGRNSCGISSHCPGC